MSLRPRRELTGLDPRPAVARRRHEAAAGTWSAPDNLSTVGQGASSPQVGAGNAIAVWRRSNGANTIIQSAVFDVVGPTISALVVPSSGNAFQQVTMGVVATDNFGLGGTRWDFGGGGVLAPGVHKPNA